jgi:hypothetical protein
MGVGPEPTADLVVEFAHLDKDDSLGTGVSWDCELCSIPEPDAIPNLEAEEGPSGFYAGHFYIRDPMIHTNANYHRELAHFEFVRRLFRPVRLLVRNTGQVVASRVRVEIVLLTSQRIIPMDEDDLPRPPKPSSHVLSNMPSLRGIRPAVLRTPGEVCIDKNDERFRIEIECGDLQPGRRIWSEVFYIGKAADGEVSLNGTLYADNLPQPKDFVLTVRGNVKRSNLTVDDLLSLPVPKGE